MTKYVLCRSRDDGNDTPLFFDTKEEARKRMQEESGEFYLRWSDKNDYIDKGEDYCLIRNLERDVCYLAMWDIYKMEL